MPRTSRHAPDGYPHHVINRGNRCAAIFREPHDCEAFLGFMAAAAKRVPMRVFAFAIMETHFHLLLWPLRGEELSAYMCCLMNAHVRHYQAVHQLTGTGHVYQGRFKNFIIQNDAHLMNVLRYVEANPLRAGCVGSADEWPWSSIGRSGRGLELLADSPVQRPANWLEIVNRPLPTEDLVALRTSVRRSRPYGDGAWVDRVVRTYGLHHTVREVGRPRRIHTPIGLTA